MSYSQNNEEEIILDYFKGRSGNFLDIGALDGIEISNTRGLLECGRGWSGVYIEPDPRSLIKLMDNCKPFADRVHVIAAAIGPLAGTHRLRMDEAFTWASGITDFKPAGISSELPVNYIVPVLPIADILSAYGSWGKFSFISIDAEGSDFEILKAISVNLLPELLCIEPYFESGRIKMRAYLKEVGMEIIHENKENIIARRL